MKRIDEWSVDLRQKQESKRVRYRKHAPRADVALYRAGPSGIDKPLNGGV